MQVSFRASSALRERIDRQALTAGVSVGEIVRVALQALSSNPITPSQSNPATSIDKITKKYIDGFVIPIDVNNIVQYEKVAKLCAHIWKEHGVLEYIEAIGDDLGAVAPEGRGALEIFGAQPAETLIFAYIVYESREHRDAVNAKVWADSHMKEICPRQNPELKLSFDPRRMMFGGFRVIAES